MRKKAKQEEGNDDDDDFEAVRANLEETKREQKFRARGGGVDSETLLGAGRAKRPELPVEEDGDPTQESLLNSQFSAENEGQASYTLMEQVGKMWPCIFFPIVSLSVFSVQIRNSHSKKVGTRTSLVHYVAQLDAHLVFRMT